MFEIACSLPLTSDLLALTSHPTEPLVAIGLSGGHVQTLKLPPVVNSHATQLGRRGSNGTDVVETAWTTRRHKGHSRCLNYSANGEQLFSAGTDYIVKAAKSETGRVVSKVGIPHDPEEPNNAPTAIHSLSPSTLLVATESGSLYLYDLRDSATSAQDGAFARAKPSQTHYPHMHEWVTSILPVPPSETSTSGFSKQWLTTGGGTLVLTDLRRGVLVKSEEQKGLLFSSTYVTGLPTKRGGGGGTSTGEKVAVGGEDGVLRLWERGQWDDAEQRIKVANSDEDLECTVAVPEHVGGVGKKIAVGTGEGRVRIVALGKNKILGQVMHHDSESVLGLAFDVGGRMISGGGSMLKVWNEESGDGYDDDEDDDDDEDEIGGSKSRKRPADTDSDSDNSSASTDDGSRSKRKRKKKKGGKKGKQSKATGKGQKANFAGLD